ncbi:MAG: hypothetical protein J1E41_00850 [Ruminococcus sp.]|nr:hypothetical protein [Ruminococcus sp.]
MKTKLTRLTKRSVAMILAILMMLSMLIVGTLTTANAAISGNIYFDNSKTKWSDVYCFIGHSGYLRSYRMSLDSNGVWKTDKSFSNEFGDATGIFFASASGGYSLLSGSSSYNRDNRSSLGLSSEYTATYTASAGNIGATYCYVPASASTNASLSYSQTPTTVKSNNGAVELPAVTDTDLKNVINSNYVQIFMGEDQGWGDKDTYYLMSAGSTSQKAASIGNRAEFKVNSDSIWLQATKTAVSAGSSGTYSLSNSSSWAGVTINRALSGGSGYFLTGSSSWGDCSGSAGSTSGNYAYYLQSATASISTTSKTITKGSSAGSVSATITKGYYSYNNGGNKAMHMVYYAKDSSGNLYKIGTGSDITSSSSSVTLSDTQYLPSGTYTVYGVMNDDVINVKASNTFALTVSNPTHNVTFSQSTGGTLTVNSSTTSPQSVAEGSYYTVKATPNSGWKIKSLKIDGVTETSATGKTDAYSVNKLMGTSDVVVSVEFEQDKQPVCSSVTLTRNPSDHLYVGESCTFTATANSPVSGASLTYTFYVDGVVKQSLSSRTFTTTFNDTNSHTIYVVVEGGTDYTSVESSKMTVTPTAASSSKNVTYYIDFHDNTPSSPTIKVGSGSATTLTKQGTSTVYAATVSTTYYYNAAGDKNVATSDISATVTASGTSYNITIDKGAIQTGEIWFEAINETSQSLKMDSANNSTTLIQSGYKRIYLAKPYSWGNSSSGSEPKWQNIGIYYWDPVSSQDWQHGDKMTLLGYDSSYYYYYVDVKSGVNNIIFQGWGTNTTNGKDPLAQTDDIKEIGDSNFFELSKDDSASHGYVGKKKSTGNAVIPSYTRYYSSVAMNVTEVVQGNTSTYVNIAPTYKGGKVTYTSNDTGVVTVDTSGNIFPKASGTTTITVRVYGTVGALITSNTSNADSMTYTVSVTVKDPTKFGDFSTMSLESSTSTINIPQVSGSYPAKVSDVTALVSGVTNVPKSSTGGYKNSAVITKVNDYKYEVKYAKANSTFTGYSGIQIIATATTQSIKHLAGKRYGINCWNKTGVRNDEITKTITKSNSDGVETATAKMTLDGSTFDAIYVEYTYVDITFNFDYYEYNTLRKVPKTDAKGNEVVDESGNTVYEYKNFYQYDAEYVGVEDRYNPLFNQKVNGEETHIHKIYTVEHFEVRDSTAATVSVADLINANNNYVADALYNMPYNDYYSYVLPNDKITITARDSGKYSATVNVELTHTPREYRVYLNGKLNNTVKYQEYVELTAGADAKWFQTVDGNKVALLATGESYRFRVTNEIYIQSESGATAADKENRSVVSYSGYEITHDNNVEKLAQNFYIADFFDPTKVIDPDSVPDEDGNKLPYDDVAFVGGGVMYYSLTDGVVNQNVVSAGYADSNGKANTDELKAFIKSKIELNDGSEYTDSKELAKAIAYGTEIQPTVDRVNNRSTGLVYRYLPFTVYNRNGNDLVKDEETGEFTTTTNSNTFRYSNSLQAYQYIYSSRSDNNPSNAGRDMRLYAYYIYSYTAYDKNTGIPETQYEVVVSGNYADAPTYLKN